MYWQQSQALNSLFIALNSVLNNAYKMLAEDQKQGVMGYKYASTHEDYRVKYVYSRIKRKSVWCQINQKGQLQSKFSLIQKDSENTFLCIFSRLSFPA